MVAFNTIVGFFDSHSGTLTAFATILLVVVTAFLVIATRELVNVNKIMILAQDRPWLRFYIREKDFQYDEKLPIPTFLFIGSTMLQNYTTTSALTYLHITENRADVGIN